MSDHPDSHCLTLTTDLAKILNQVQRPGDFQTSGRIDLFTPRLEVEGVGPIALPLLPIQAEQLIGVAERAPYGRGEETLVDTQVRRTWQIDPQRVRLGGRHWQETLETIITRAAQGLGVDGAVEADLYKLLVYDPGSFFVPHRDTEKAPGMFATLVIVLPSAAAGGELVIRHRDRTVELDLNCPEPSQAAFAAFYADCVHEVRPVTAGCRLSLIYNLRRPGKGQPPQPPRYDAEQARATQLLRRWVAGKTGADDDLPHKLIYPLEHAYSQAELAFAALKGADAAVAGVLVAAARQAEVDIHLARLSIEESGGAEYYGSWSRRHSTRDEDFEIIEVYDRSLTLSDWRTPEDEQPALDKLPFSEEELSPPVSCEDLEPDETQFHEATGNEGASFERTYRRAALVLWPRSQRLRVLNQGSLSLTLPYLGQLTERWQKAGKPQESPLWQEAHELTGYMLESWPSSGRRFWESETSDSKTATLLELLVRLNDTDHLERFLTDITATGRYGKGDNEALVKALGQLPPSRAAQRLQEIIAGNAREALRACADLLARCAAAVRNQPLAIDLQPAARSLAEALPGDPAQAPPVDYWHRPAAMEAGILVDLLPTLDDIDPALAARAAEHCLAWPAVYDPDKVLLPALRTLLGQSAHRDRPALQTLQQACLAHLRRRIDQPLEPPRDFSRDASLVCQCQDCRELGRFLADAGQRTWTLKAAQARRSHVEQTVRQSQSDLNLSTDTRGRPYSLICTKNQASYERRARQRHQDLADLALLEDRAG